MKKNIEDLPEENKPKIRGKGKKVDHKIVVCEICGNGRAVIKFKGIYFCRRCFKENAESMGFVKYH